MISHAATERVHLAIVAIATLAACVGVAHAQDTVVSREMIAIQSVANGKYVRPYSSSLKATRAGYGNADGLSQMRMTTYDDGKVSFETVWGTHWFARVADAAVEQADDTSDGATRFTLTPCTRYTKPNGHEDWSHETTCIRAVGDRFIRYNPSNDKLIKTTLTDRDFAGDNHKWRIVRLGRVLTTPVLDGDAVRDGDTVTFSGRFELPLYDGSSIALPAAQLTITYNAFGEIESVDGTAGLPVTPDNGLMGALGQVGMDAGHDTTVSVGYGMPDQFDTYGLPLDPTAKYYYLNLVNGGSAGWGGLSMSSPDSGSVLLAIDPETGTVFGYCDLPVFGGAVEYAAFGVSVGSAIPFTPLRNDVPVIDGFTGHTFHGEAYLSARAQMASALIASLWVDGEITMSVNDGTFGANGFSLLPRGQFGINATADLQLDIGPLSLAEMHLGSLTAYIRNWKNSTSFAGLSGRISGDQVLGMPFGLSFPLPGTAFAWLWAYVDEDPTDSNPGFARIFANVEDFDGFDGVRLTGTFELHEEDGMSFDGSLLMDGTELALNGEFDEHRSAVTTRISTAFVVVTTTYEVDVTVGVELGDQPGLSLAADGRICNLGVACIDSPASVEVTSSGALRVCVAGECTRL